MVRQNEGDGKGRIRDRTAAGRHAFRNCKNLKYVRVPKGAEIASDAFEGCGSVIIDRIAE